MSERAAAAVESLVRLGLRTYEAKVFVGLQRLGTGTASEIADAAEVPRSQVYGAAEDLEERGLVEVEPATPTRYRPVSLDEARSRLLARLESEGDRAFDALSRIRAAGADADERREEIWTLRGRDSVADRTAALLRRADERVLYGAADASAFGPRVTGALRERVDAGVEAAVISRADDALAAAAEIEGVRTVSVPAALDPEIGGGRVLVSDRNTVLVSVVGDRLPDVREETAFWTRETAFASFLSAAIEGWVEHVAESVDTETPP